MALVVVELIDVRVDLPSQFAVATLVETDAPYRKLEMPLGLPEANSLAYALKRIETSRPITHELIVKCLSKFNIEVLVVRVTGRAKGIYSAEMELGSPRGREVVDCRPSDAMTVGLRCAVRPPILLEEKLFDDANDV